MLEALCARHMFHKTGTTCQQVNLGLVGTWVLCRPYMWVQDIVIIFLFVTSITSNIHCRVTPRSGLCVSITRCRRRVITLASRVTLKSLTSPPHGGGACRDWYARARFRVRQAKGYQGYSGNSGARTYSCWGALEQVIAWSWSLRQQIQWGSSRYARVQGTRRRPGTHQ